MNRTLEGALAEARGKNPSVAKVWCDVGVEQVDSVRVSS